MNLLIVLMVDQTKASIVVKKTAKPKAGKVLASQRPVVALEIEAGGFDAGHTGQRGKCLAIAVDRKNWGIFSMFGLVFGLYRRSVVAAWRSAMGLKPDCQCHEQPHRYFLDRGHWRFV